MSLAYCANELTNVIQCVQSNEDTCNSCFIPSKIAEDLPLKLETQFRQTLAFIPPTMDGFCDEANARVCDYHEEAMKCCCKEETMQFIECAFNNVYIAKYGVLEACSQGCGSSHAKNDGGTGGSSMIMILVIVVTLFFSLGFCTCLYCRHKATSTEDGADKLTGDCQKTTTKSGDEFFGGSEKTDLTGRNTMIDSDHPDVEMGLQTKNTEGIAALATLHHTEAKSETPAEKTKKEIPQHRVKSLRVDACGMIHDANNISLEPSDINTINDKPGQKIKKGKTQGKLGKKKKAQSIRDMQISAEELDVAEEANNVGKSKGKKMSASAVHSIYSEHIEEAIEMENTLLQAEREAKMLRFEQRVSTKKLMHLAESQKEAKEKLKEAEKRARMAETDMQYTLTESKVEKKGMSKALRRMEREREEMAEHIARLEAENSEMYNSNMEDPSYYGVEVNEGPPPIGSIGVEDTRSTGGFALDSSYHDDDDSHSAGRLAVEISRRSGHPQDRNQDPEMNVIRYSSHSTNTEPHSLTSHSSSRYKQGRGLSDSAHHKKRLKNKRSKSKERFMVEEEVERRPRSERLQVISDRSEGRSMRRTKSAVKLPSRSLHRSPARKNSKLARLRSEALTSRSDHHQRHLGHFDRKLARATSENKMTSMEPPHRGLVRTKSERRPNNGDYPAADRMVRRTHSGDKLRKVERYY